MNPYLVTEALASSRIEGTQASLSDVFEASAEEGPSPDIDVREVQNYVAAFELGRSRLTELPLSSRLIREMHARLLADVRGEEKNPGEFRTTQNWIGRPGGTIENATFVPPRHDPEMMEALTDWERFLHETDDLPPLVACGLAHYQFETIHPFLDGNGRIGRLVIILLLVSLGELPEPLLYLTPARRPLRGSTRATPASLLAPVLLADVRSRHRDSARSTGSVTTRRVMRALGITNAGANSVIRRIEARGWLEEFRVEGRGGRITWVAPEVMDILTT